MKPGHQDPLPKASRLGLFLFTAYTLFYGGFVYLAAFRGDLLAKLPFAGVNTAIHYGFALIAVPLILALIYLKWAGKAKD